MLVIDQFVDKQGEILEFIDPENCLDVLEEAALLILQTTQNKPEDLAINVALLNMYLYNKNLTRDFKGFLKLAGFESGGRVYLDSKTRGNE